MTQGGPPRPAEDVRIRIGDPLDASFAASLHANLIPEGFLSSLGEGLLRRLYRRVTRSPGSFLLVAECGDEGAGFLAGTVALGRLYREFALRDGVAAAARAARRLLVSWPQAIETLRHAGRGSAGGDRACGELLAIAVDPEHRRSGAGRMLVDGFVAQLARRDVRCAQVVVGADNIAAVALYEQAGFRPESTLELHRGTTSLLMTRTVGAGPDRAAHQAGRA